jgi:integrase
VVDRIGERRLQSLTAPMLTRLYGELSESLAPRTVRGVHTVLRQALADAVAWQRLGRNPADRAKPPSVASIGDMPPRTWSARQLDDFLTHVQTDRLYAAWRVLAMTGIRRGELLGLSWGAVDLDTARLAITRTLIEGKGAPRFSEPKTKRGRRSVALDPITVDALLEHRRRQLDERLAWGPAYESHDLVFCRENGTPIWPRTFSRSFDNHVRDAGLPKIRLHDLRHTHATLALEAGVHPKVRPGAARARHDCDHLGHLQPRDPGHAGRRGGEDRGTARRSPVNEQVTAYHEAGHAVARFVLGRRIDRVSIIPDDESLGHVRGYVLRKIGEDWDYTLRDVQLLEDEIVSMLAGEVTETRLTGRENPVGAQHDRDNAAMLAVHLEGPDVAEPYLNYLEARARALIGAHW